MQNSSYPVLRYWTLFFFLILTFRAEAQSNDELLTILVEEMDRGMNALKKTTHPPYYLSYRVEDIQYTSVQASFGSLVYSDGNRNKVLSVKCRLGDYSFDNTHPREDNRFSTGGGGERSILPLENKSEAVKFFLWKATEQAYKSGLESYKAIKSATAKPVASAVPDFSKETAQQYFEEPLDYNGLVNKEDWEKRTRELSGLFLKNHDLVTGDVTFSSIAARKYLVSTEGTSIVHNTLHYYAYVNASIRAADGDVLPLHITYFAYQQDGLPSTEKMAKDIEQLIAKLDLLKDAPLAEPYSGPAILDAQASGVFFHEIFGHRVEGHRLKDEMDGQTFKGKVQQQVLPKHISVIFDPTMEKFNDQFLNGAYRYDDEGTKARKVVAVRNGILQSFLMSRTPLDNFPASNGHGRASAGAEAVSRQSNLIVETTKALPMNDLRKLLIRECKRQGKPYGYYFKDVVGGFTNTERFSPNAFNIFPTEVYRIYADGRPDEIVRGVDLIGTPLSMFAEITATGDKNGVFHGFCGAESGSVPVSAVSPALFVKRIETQKKPKIQHDTTLLSRPSEN